MLACELQGSVSFAYACQVKLTGTLGYVAKGVARLHGGIPGPVGCLAARRIRLTGSAKERSPNR